MEKSEKLSLHQKILKIADMAGALQRTKEGYGYKYVPEEDIQAKVTAGLQKYGVMLYVSVVPGTFTVTPYQYEKYDPKIKGLKPVNEVIVSAELKYTWVNTDNPEEKVETSWMMVGQMEDAAQAMGAGLTYSNRYYLMKQLQLATTESDPDNYRSKQKKAEAEALEKTANEELTKSVKKVVAAGTELIKAGGVESGEMMEIVAKYNDGNGNPNSIKSTSVCEKILAEFKAISERKQAQ